MNGWMDEGREVGRKVRVSTLKLSAKRRREGWKSLGGEGKRKEGKGRWSEDE